MANNVKYIRPRTVLTVDPGSYRFPRRLKRGFTACQVHMYMTMHLWVKVITCQIRVKTKLNGIRIITVCLLALEDGLS